MIDPRAVKFAKMDAADATAILRFLYEVIRTESPLKRSESFVKACEVFGLRPYFISGGAMKPHLDYFLPEKL